MSHYKDLLTSGREGMKSFLLQIGQHDEAVMYRLGPDGKPSSMTVGKIVDVLGGAFGECKTHVVVKHPGWREYGDHVADSPSNWTREYFDTWAEAVEAINKRTARGQRARGVLDALYYLDLQCPYIEFDGWRSKAAITEAGRRCDERWEREQAEYATQQALRAAQKAAKQNAESNGEAAS